MSLVLCLLFGSNKDFLQCASYGLSAWEKNVDYKECVGYCRLFYSQQTELMYKLIHVSLKRRQKTVGVAVMFVSDGNSAISSLYSKYKPLESPTPLFFHAVNLTNRKQC